MSFVTAAPEMLATAAQNVANIGTSLSAANATAAASTTSVLAAGADEVSQAIARLFSDYATHYQSLNAQAAAFHHSFVQTLNAAGGAYSSAEAANASAQALEQNLLAVINAPAQALFGRPLIGNGANGTAASPNGGDGGILYGNGGNGFSQTTAGVAGGAGGSAGLIGNGRQWWRRWGRCCRRGRPARAGGAVSANATDTPRRRRRDVTITAPVDMRPFAVVSGDHNPIHTDRAAALLAGLESPIVHGMWLSAAAQHAVTATDGQARPPARLVGWTRGFWAWCAPATRWTSASSASESTRAQRLWTWPRASGRI